MSNSNCIASFSLCLLLRFFGSNTRSLNSTLDAAETTASSRDIISNLNPRSSAKNSWTNKSFTPGLWIWNIMLDNFNSPPWHVYALFNFTSYTFHHNVRCSLLVYPMTGMHACMQTNLYNAFIHKQPSLLQLYLKCSRHTSKKIHPLCFLPSYRICRVLTLECYLTLQNKCSNLGKDKFPLDIGSSSIFASVHLCWSDFTTAVDIILFVCFLFFLLSSASTPSSAPVVAKTLGSSFHVFS